MQENLLFDIVFSFSKHLTKASALFKIKQSLSSQIGLFGLGTFYKIQFQEKVVTQVVPAFSSRSWYTASLSLLGYVKLKVFSSNDMLSSNYSYS